MKSIETADRKAAVCIYVTLSWKRGTTRTCRTMVLVAKMMVADAYNQTGKSLLLRAGLKKYRSLVQTRVCCPRQPMDHLDRSAGKVVTLLSGSGAGRKPLEVGTDATAVRRASSASGKGATPQACTHAIN